jgi:hypothetical protein
MSARSKIAALEAKLSAYTAEINAKIAELQVEAAGEVDPAQVTEGATITFNYGRKDNAKVYVGLVLGVKSAEGKTTVKAQVGTGFDAEVFVVGLPAITAVTPVPTPEGDTITEVQPS